MIVGDRVCLAVVSTSSLLSCDESQSSVGDETGSGTLWQWSCFWRMGLQADKGSSEKASPHLCCFSRLARNNQCAKAPYLGSWTSPVAFWCGIFWYPSRVSLNLWKNIMFTVDYYKRKILLLPKIYKIQKDIKKETNHSSNPITER